MTDERSPPSALRGRLADIYVPALVAGTLDALSRRLGDRATIDDPLCGRASNLAAIDPLLARVATYFKEGNATYEHLCSTTGVDRDAAEGRLALTIGGELREVPIAIVAERRRLREIELRVYYDPQAASPGRKERAPLVSQGPLLPLPQRIELIVEGIRAGSLEQALAGFEESARIVDRSGRSHTKSDGSMRTFLDELSTLDLTIGGCADDGRTACIECTVTRRDDDASPTLFAFERSDSGLVRELRVYG